MEPGSHLLARRLPQRAVHPELRAGRQAAHLEHRRHHGGGRQSAAFGVEDRQEVGAEVGEAVHPELRIQQERLAEGASCFPLPAKHQVSDSEQDERSDTLSFGRSARGIQREAQQCRCRIDVDGVDLCARLCDGGRWASLS